MQICYPRSRSFWVFKTIVFGSFLPDIFTEDNKFPCLMKLLQNKILELDFYSEKTVLTDIDLYNFLLNSKALKWFSEIYALNLTISKTNK